MSVQQGNLPIFLVPHERMDLPEMEVHIWAANLQEISLDHAAQAYLSWLQPEELDQWKRYQVAKSKHEFLMARVLMRTALSSYVPEKLPQEWQFQKNSAGRPDLVVPSAFSFNWSHSQDWVVGAISKGGQVGVDIENLCRNTAIMELAHHHFSESECLDLLPLSEESRRNRFFQYWTLKEAYSKARGLGLLLPLRATSFQLGPMQHGKSINIQLVLLEGALKTAIKDGQWAFWLQEFGPNHMMALALHSKKQSAVRIVNIKYYKFNIV